MGDDEEATFRTLASYRTVIDRVIEQHHGRFVNSAGDSVLAEFGSVVKAVQCGIDIQFALKAENARLPDNRRLNFRIGINLGDVIVDGDQIYGDGVNVAARLENLAEPGGICISDKVRDEARGKLLFNYSDLGLQKFKNIAEPVRVWRVSLNEVVRGPRDIRQVARRHWRGGVLSLAGLAIIAATIVLVQHVSLRSPQISGSIPPPVPGVALPDKPSIAVLPFANMSGDRDQEYFSDGITDDLITDLSRLPGVFVIARESSFTYKGRPAKLQEVGRELGVKYVLGGAVRKAAGQARITVQLADATTGADLWAERYDRPLRDVFALQDEIVRKIVTTMNFQLALAQQGIVIPRTTENLEAYDALLRGTEYLFSFTKEGNAKARQLFERAIELDPRYAYAYASLGMNYFAGYVLALDPAPRGLEGALQMAQRAIALDDSLAWAHLALALIYSIEHKTEGALSEAQRTIALDPNSAAGYAALGQVLNNQWKPAQALAAVEKAIRLDPRNIVNYLDAKGQAHVGLGQWQEAIEALKGHLGRYPDHIWDHVQLAIAYYNLGDHDAARGETGGLERLAARTPNSEMGYTALIYTLDEQGKPVEALAMAEKGRRLKAQSPSFLILLGSLYNQLGRWEESLAALKPVPRDLHDVWFHALLATDYSALGQRDAARTEALEVERIVAGQRDFWEGYRALAIALLVQGKDAEALVAVEKGMHLEPGSRVKYLWAQAICYARLGRWEEALSALEAYVAHYPDQVLPHIELAVEYVEVGRDDPGRAEIAHALRLDPQFSLRNGITAVPLADKDRVAVDLAKAGLT